MTGHCTQALRLAALAVSLGTIGAASLKGQDPREAPVARAFREFDPAARQRLLITAINPSLGPLQGAWPVGVQLLAQMLIENGKDSTAAAWLRWAIRLSPDLRPDTVLFLPAVVRAHHAARAYVVRTQRSVDSAAETSWLWPAQADGEQGGRLLVAPSVPVSVGVQVSGVGAIGAGESVSLKPGSYEITAVASGDDTVRVTREVLPGVITELAFPFRAPVPPVVANSSPEKKKGFPVLWVGLATAAAAGVVALVAVLDARGDSPPAQTGGIIFTFPGP